MSELKKRRNRLNPTHRWTESQTLDLLEKIAAAVRKNPDSYEKPTSRLFFDTISRLPGCVHGIEWFCMKNKMRYLRQHYVTAALWKVQTGAQYVTNGDTDAVQDYMSKNCPFYYLLEQIFVNNKKAAQLYLEGSQQSNGDYDAYTMDSSNAMELTNNSYDTAMQECREVVNYAGDDMTQQRGDGDFTDADYDPLSVVMKIEESPREDDDEENTVDSALNSSTASGADFNAFKDQLKQQAKKRQKTTVPPPPPMSKPAPQSANSGSITLLVSMQEKKLQFEELKWEKQQELDVQKLELEKDKLRFAREQISNELELKKIEMKQQLEIKRLELARDERLALAKMKMEFETQERIKKYEMELKLKK